GNQPRPIAVGPVWRACVVHQNIQRSQTLRRLVDHPLRIGLDPNITGQRNGATAECGKFSHEGLQPAPVDRGFRIVNLALVAGAGGSDIRYRDIRACSCQRERDRTPDTLVPTAPCYESDLAIEVAHFCHVGLPSAAAGYEYLG